MIECATYVNFGLIILIITISGTLGGYVSFIFNKKDGEIAASKEEYILTGLCAAMTIPLFLNMISSKIIPDILEASKPSHTLSQALILMGFCIIASIYSKNFLGSVSEKILQKAQEAQKNSIEAKDKANAALEATSHTQDEIQPIIAASQEPESIDSPLSSKINHLSQQWSLLQQVDSLSENERKILETLVNNKYTFRSISGLSKDSGMEQDIVSQTISELLKKDLVGERIGESGQPRWFIQQKGRLALL